MCLQGAHVKVKVWDKDQPKSFFPYDLVEEFSYNFDDDIGSDHRLVTIDGQFGHGARQI